MTDVQFHTIKNARRSGLIWILNQAHIVDYADSNTLGALELKY